MTERRERQLRELISGIGALIVIAYVVARARNYSLFSSGQFPSGVIYGGDSVLYFRDAHQPVWSWAFLAAREGRGGGGPFAFLLLVKMCRYHVAAVMLVQGALWIAGFRYLANSASACFTYAATRLFVTTVVWALAVSAPLLQWTAGVGTEALSIVATVFVVGAGLRWAFAPDERRRSVVLAVALLTAALTRDTNALAVLMVAGLLVIVAATRRAPWRSTIAIALVALIGSGVALGLASHARRWYYPLQETVALRLQGDDVAHGYLVAHGFPDSPAVRRLSTDYLTNSPAADSAPQYAPFRQWLEDHGRRTYLGFLATHPRWLFGKWWGQRPEILVSDVGSYAVAFGVPRPQVSRFAAAVVIPSAWWWFWVRLIIVMALVVAATVRAGRHDARWLRWLAVLSVLGALWLVQALAAFHGDAYEVARHELSAWLQLQLVIWLAAAAAVETLWRTRREVSPESAG